MRNPTKAVAESVTRRSHRVSEPRTAMTAFDRCLATLISPERITYLPASYDKRFGGAMASIAADPDAKITDHQRALLVSKIVRYRRQIFDKRSAAVIKRAQANHDPAAVEAAIIAAVAGLIGGKQMTYRIVEEVVPEIIAR